MSDNPQITGFKDFALVFAISVVCWEIGTWIGWELAKWLF